MADKFSEFSERRAAMTDAAALAEGLVKECALPVLAGESVKAQMRRSASRLRRNGLSGASGKVKRAWYREAGASTYLEIKRAYDRWQAGLGPVAMAEKLNALRTLLNDVDPEFHREAVQHLGNAVRALQRESGDDGQQAD